MLICIKAHYCKYYLNVNSLKRSSILSDSSWSERFWSAFVILICILFKHRNIVSFICVHLSFLFIFPYYCPCSASLTLIGSHWLPRTHLPFPSCGRHLTVQRLDCPPSPQSWLSHPIVLGVCFSVGKRTKNSRKGLRLVTLHCVLPFKWHFCFNSCFWYL